MLRPPTSTLFPYTTLFRSMGFRTHALSFTSGTEGRLEATKEDRKSTRLNSSHVRISYAVFCLKKKTDDSAHHVLKRLRTEVLGHRQGIAVQHQLLGPQALD